MNQSLFHKTMWLTGASDAQQCYYNLYIAINVKIVSITYCIPQHGKQTNVPWVRLAAWGALAEQSAQFLFPSNLWSFLTISSGPSAVFLRFEACAREVDLDGSYSPGFLSILFVGKNERSVWLGHALVKLESAGRCVVTKDPSRWN